MADQAFFFWHMRSRFEGFPSQAAFKAWITFNLIIKVLSFNFTLINKNTGEFFENLLSNAEDTRWLTSNAFMMVHDSNVWKLGFKRTTC